MKNFFLLELQRTDQTKKVNNTYRLNHSVTVKINQNFPNAIIDTEDYFYYRFGNLLGQKGDVVDRTIAKELLNNDADIIACNSGYFGVFFFDKKLGAGSIFADRIGLHKTYFHRSENALIISNQVKKFDFKPSNEINKSWLNEIVNFKICTGSYTYNSDIKQLPAGQYFVFDENLKPANAGFYWSPLDRKEHSDISLNEATDQSLRLLNKHLEDANTKDKKVAVLLSGGVDSSLLAALTKEHNNHVIAITPVFTSGENPELPMAKLMAKQINIEHQIIEISDLDIQQEFAKTVQLLQQPIRSPQTIIFSILMRKFTGKVDAIVFGEGADMIFGYHGVSLPSKRYKKYIKFAFLQPLIPFLNLFKFNHSVKKLTDLIQESVTTQVLNSWAIAYPPVLKKKLPNMVCTSDEIEIIKWLKLSGFNYKNLTPFKFENLVRKFIIYESCMYHFYSMGAIADREGIELICPFFDVNVVEYAANFDNKLYFGDEFTKPILRKIGEKYYSKDLIYAKKKGFPVPHKKWLSGPLETQAANAKKFINQKFGALATDNEEFVWLIMAMQELAIESSLETANFQENISP